MYKYKSFNNFEPFNSEGVIIIWGAAPPRSLAGVLPTASASLAQKSSYATEWYLAILALFKNNGI